MDVYLEEYTSAEAIEKYTTRTAGHGISYLLQHDYAEVYLNALENYLRVPNNTPLRLLEFGCGGGMNIINLLALLERRGRKVEVAYGTDFSPRLVDAANSESKSLLTPAQQGKMHFAVARNEELAANLSAAIGMTEQELNGYFHVILGVNTFRYCHRLGKTKECAHDIARLLTPGGICINIDMNQRFPAFRSKWRKSERDTPEIESYLPSLEEYASPFAEAGLEIVRKENFCWIPHSATPAMTAALRFLTPVLNTVARPWAMRSLVISRKSA